MKFRVSHTFYCQNRTTFIPPMIEESIDHVEYLKEFKNALVTKLILDQYSYIPTRYQFETTGDGQYIAESPEIPGIKVLMNLVSGEVKIECDEKVSSYRVVAVEISIPLEHD